MTLRFYLIIMTATTAICWLAFVLVINMVDPEITNWIGFLLFYLSLFVSLIGTASIIGFLVRFIILRKELIFRSVKEAFRQSFLLSFLIVASLLLLSRDLFTWFNMVMLAVSLTVLEFFLVSYKTTNH